MHTPDLHSCLPAASIHQVHTPDCQDFTPTLPACLLVFTYPAVALHSYLSACLVLVLSTCTVTIKHSYRVTAQTQLHRYRHICTGMLLTNWILQLSAPVQKAAMGAANAAGIAEAKAALASLRSSVQQAMSKTPPESFKV